ncbi:hypothetical protein BY458DRAFT_533482 [Sporodiniella umbellata]|nr:hypothetical protein BY458DRAFT_533482 [Sporodiniella umbellata]
MLRFDSADRLIDYLEQKQVLVWMGNVREAESHKVSYALQATMYPFTALIGLQPQGADSQMTVIERTEGMCDAEGIVASLTTAMARHGSFLQQLKSERAQRSQERQLREDQDKAYRDSLKADQAKAKKVQEEREAWEKEQAKVRERERVKDVQAQKKEAYIHSLLSQLGEEPKEGRVTKLSFRLADGARVVRLFSEHDSLETLYRFVEVYPWLDKVKVTGDEKAPEDYKHAYSFKIQSPYPRIEYEADPYQRLGSIASLWPAATLVVDTVDEACFE